MKKSIILSTILLLSGCSAVSSFVADKVLGSDTNGLSVDTEIVAGDKQQVAETGKITKSDTKFDDVMVKDGGKVEVTTNNTSKAKEQNVDASNAKTVTLNSGFEFWEVILMCLASGVFCLLCGLFLPQVKISRK